KRKPLFFEQGDLGNNKRLGYGVPLVNDQNKMYGSVIVLSRKDKTLTQSFADYHLLIWSVSIALIITVFISIGMAKKFVKPIHDMEQFTDDLIKQKYSSTLDIKTKDELATLGSKLAVLSDRLAFAKNEQDNKEKSQKLFLSQISHELRTPVMVIKNSLETLNSDFLNETEKKDYIHHLMKETEQLNLLVNDLLELSRLQSTEFSITTEELNLNYVIQDSMRSYRPILKDKNQSISFESDINEEPMFVGDYQRLLQLMKILIDNASKYSADNSVIDVHLKKVGNNYEVSVRNTPNFEIDEVRMSHIFDAFNRGSEKQENGHGLGLTIAEQIVKRHFGKIYFQIIDNSMVEVVIKL
ncbi:sensor histidine kinase, partial [Vagococcus sp.]|uniref:sensor histidine kinase n=1 Tax=Vagococcus sp. TaxID=1933889 RepID=UPI002FCABA42